MYMRVTLVGKGRKIIDEFKSVVPVDDLLDAYETTKIAYGPSKVPDDTDKVAALFKEHLAGNAT